jgi:hypothetical protein
VSDQQPEPTSAETGSASVAASDVRNEPVTIESPAIAPDQELTAPKADVPKADAPKIEPKPEFRPEPKAEAPKEAPKIEPKAEQAPEPPRPSGKVIVMSPGERISAGGDAKAEAEPAAPRRRVAAMAAMVALAAVAGAIGGALATAGLGHGSASEAAAARNVGLETAIARIDADIVALKASVEQNAKLGVTQFNKTGERLDKMEKAQAEPSSKLAKLSEEVAKIRAAQVAPAAAAPAPAAASRDVTGSVTPPATQSAAASAKVDVGRLPTVEGWVLRDVGRGSALIEGRGGLYEVFAGDPVPGLGRIDAIRKQDGRWVVVTSKGLIVAR